MRSLELVLDAASEARIRDDWDALIRAGLPSAGRHTGASNRPHITLVATAHPIDPDAVALPSSALPLDLPLAGLLLFGASAAVGPEPRAADGRVVLARAVTPSDALLALQRSARESVAGVLPTAEPGAWTPHVTLARRLPVHRIADALDVVGAERSAVRAVGLRLWDSATRTVTALAGEVS